MNEASEIFLAIGTFLVFAALIPAYGILITLNQVPWRESRLGRVLHSKSLSIAVILTWSVFAGLVMLLGYGRPLWFEVLRMLALLYVTVALYRQWGAYRDILKTRELTHPKQYEDDPLR